MPPLPGPALVVPIDVAALCVGTPDTQPGGGAHGMPPLMDFSQLPAAGGTVAPNVSGQLVDRPFSSPLPIVSGVHLHWALPDGLTHGIQRDQTQAVVFPSVPNRWLVTRVIVRTDDLGASTMTSWVVESDRLAPTTALPAQRRHPTVPFPSDEAQPYRYIGQAFPAASWSESTAERPSQPLTAVGYGEPTWAAFYPNVSTVFGLLDSFSDEPVYDPATCKLAYHVAGWYHSPAVDPALAGIPATDNQYHWSFPATSPPGSTVCSGVVELVPWDPNRRFLTDDPKQLDVAIGPSSQEAVAALLAYVLGQTTPSYAGAEEILNALQFGLLGQAETPDAIANYEERVHSAGFASRAGGSAWAIVKADPGGVGQGEELTLSQALAASLAALNAAQATYDDALVTIDSSRRALFLDWYRYLQVNYGDPSVPDDLRATTATIRQRLNASAASIAALTTQAQQLKAQLDPLVSTVRTALPAGRTLEQRPLGPRYFRPSNPVLVLHGLDATPPRRYGGDADQGALACRLGGALLTGCSIPVSGSTGWSIVAAASDLPLPQYAPTDVPVVAAALIHDALFAAPSLQSIVARAATVTGGTGTAPTLTTQQKLDGIATAYASFVQTAGATFQGVAPAPMMVATSANPPWLPIMLQYEADLRPLRQVGDISTFDPFGTYPPDWMENAFSLETDGIDNVPAEGSNPITEQAYLGTALVGQNAAVDLIEQINRFRRSTGDTDPELARIAAALASLPLLSQSLTGFDDALLLREQTAQLPVADPFADAATQPIVAAVRQQVASANGVGPAPDPDSTSSEPAFNPIRTGLLALARLRLVDAFGRCKDYSTDLINMVVAKGLQAPATVSASSDQAFLPPRLAQPSRLLFRWRAAYDDTLETNSHPASSPVLGWVVPDYLDNSLVLYDADGAPLAEFRLSADGSSVLFTPAPGGEFPPAATPDQVLAGANDHLRAFANGIYNGGDASFFAPFFANVRRALAVSLPASFKQDTGTAVLLGQPLALARASLALQLGDDLPEYDTWEHWKKRFVDHSEHDVVQFGSVRFPVMLGATAKLDDTLVGFWLDANGATDFRAFYSPYATAESGGVRPASRTTISLSPALTSSSAVTVTLLLDPRGGVHATTGILPVKQIAIPPDQYAGGLSRLAVTFGVGPVLSPTTSAGPAIARPKVTAGEWAWVTDGGQTWVTQALGDEPPAEPSLDPTPQRIASGWLRLSHTRN